VLGLFLLAFSDLAPSMALPYWSIKARGFCPVAFLARRARGRWGGFAFCGCLAALGGICDRARA